MDRSMYLSTKHPKTKSNYQYHNSDISFDCNTLVSIGATPENHRQK